MACNGVPSSFFLPNFLYQMQPQQMEESHPLVLPASMPQADLRGVAAMLGKRGSMFSEDAGGGEDELSDDGSQAGEKKRRLSLEQVRTLERSFEHGNKLEPERKVQLARALGLQPRQVAIWFQNRRARWKTKQLEKDYEALQREFDAVRAENDELHVHNKKLQAELLALKGWETQTEPFNLNKETEGSSSNRGENGSDMNLDVPRSAPAIDRQTSPNHGIEFFPSYKQQAMNQFLHGNTMSRPELHCPKTEHSGIVVGQEESLCNIFGAIDDQPAIWGWGEQHNFN